MSFWDYLTAGKKYRDTDDDYGREYSRPRRVEYKAYCKKCGAYTYRTFSSAGDAVRCLQNQDYTYNTYGRGCGQRNHLAEIEKVEV